MGRIRTIKPELPHSESLGNVSRDARLCFVLMFTIADDEGRLRGNPKMLAGLLFPYDADAPKLMDKWLSDLEGEGCIARYEHEGKAYVAILNWAVHQKIDKPSSSKLPCPRESSRILANSSEGSPNAREDSSEDQGSRKGSKDQGKDQGTEGISTFVGPASGPTGRDEISWRVEETWAAHERATLKFYERHNGVAPSSRPTLTKEIRDAIRSALREYDSDLLSEDKRDEWKERSKARAAGIGIFLDPFLTGQTPDNDRNNGGKLYLEHWRPWKKQRGKGDPVEKFAELYFEAKDVKRAARG